MNCLKLLKKLFFQGENAMPEDNVEPSKDIDIKKIGEGSSSVYRLIISNFGDSTTMKNAIAESEKVVAEMSSAP